MPTGRLLRAGDDDERVAGGAKHLGHRFAGLAVIIDDQHGKGGVVQVLADDIDSFTLKYLDPMSGLWTDTWDTTSTIGQPNRLPLQVEIYLVLKAGPAGEPIRLRTKTTLQMLQPLAFALK